ncbi:MAG: nucleotide exchange factor GrpE [Ignavibacteriales bacterium]
MEKCNHEHCTCEHELEEENCTCDDECSCEHENCTCNDECSCEHEEQEIKKEDKHTNKLNEAYNKISELEDALLRSKAEFINYRKRLEDEQSRLLKFCNEDIIKEILPIIDNFERAISMDDDNLNDEVSKFLSGFKLIYGNLISILNAYEVVEIKSLNEPFDPTYHQAVLTEEKEGTEPGIVLEVLQKGYLLKGKVMRPAMVKVSK